MMLQLGEGRTSEADDVRIEKNVGRKSNPAADGVTGG